MDKIHPPEKPKEGYLALAPDEVKSSQVAQLCPTLCDPMGFSKQEYWSGLPLPSPEDLPHPGIKPGSLSLLANSLLTQPPGKPKEH